MKSTLFWTLLFLMYFISHGISLFHDAYFWDDFSIIGVPKDVIFKSFVDAGRPLLGYLHAYLAHLPGAVTLYKWLNFVGYFVVSVLFYLNLSSFRNFFSTHERQFLTIIFCLFPYDCVRHELVDFQYILCFALFLLGCTLFIRHLEKRSIRVLTLLLFFLSFTIEVHLFLYGVLLVVYLFRFSGADYKATFNRLIKQRLLLSYFDFIFLPIAYWTIRKVFFTPSGALSGINSIGKRLLLESPFGLLKAFYYSFLETLAVSFAHSFHWMFLFVIVLFGYSVSSALRDALIKADYSLDDYFRSKKLFVFGVFMFLAGAFPFVVVGKIPSNQDWDGRFQLVLPIGTALMIYFGLALFRRARLQGFFLVLVILLSVNENLVRSWYFVRDGLKQKAFVALFKGDPQLLDIKRFLIEDETIFLNANRRSFRFYEYNGLLERAFGNQTRLAVNLDEQASYEGRFPSFESDEMFRKLFHFKNVDPGRFEKVIKITEGSVSLRTMVDIISMWWLERFDKAQFNERIKLVLRASVRSI